MWHNTAGPEKTDQHSAITWCYCKYWAFCSAGKNSAESCRSPSCGWTYKDSVSDVLFYSVLSLIEGELGEGTTSGNVTLPLWACLWQQGDQILIIKTQVMLAWFKQSKSLVFNVASCCPLLITMYHVKKAVTQYFITIVEHQVTKIVAADARTSQKATTKAQPLDCHQMFPTSSRTFDVLHFLLHKFYWNFFAEFKCIMWSLL